MTRTKGGTAHTGHPSDVKVFGGRGGAHQMCLGTRFCLYLKKTLTAPENSTADAAQ